MLAFFCRWCESWVPITGWAYRIGHDSFCQDCFMLPSSPRKPPGPL